MAIARRNYRAFTLVELLVVIAILGVLMALLFPAVGAVRDAMRRAQCKNNLRQLGEASNSHCTKLGYFPSNGWGYYWTGDPDRGFGASQPGGWLYNILPFVGLDTIHDIGKGAAVTPADIIDSTANGKKGQALVTQQSSCVPFFICAARRKAISYPLGVSALNSALPSSLCKTDYAINGGSIPFGNGSGQYPTPHPGPTPSSNPSSSCYALFPKCTGFTLDLSAFNGVSGERSQVTPGQIPDGLSNVILAGEKFVNLLHYNDSQDPGDTHSAFEGNDFGTARWVYSLNQIPQPMKDDKQDGLPPTTAYWFGSPHSQGTHFVFCDGSVKMINYNIDFPTYQSLAVRNDGNPSENF